MSKLMMVAAGAVGYVLGARAGKERYTEIKTKAAEMWQNPKVQEKKDQAQDLMKDKAPQVQGKVSDVASKAAAKGKRAASRKSDEETDLGVDTAVVAPAPVNGYDAFGESSPAADGVELSEEDQKHRD